MLAIILEQILVDPRLILLTLYAKDEVWGELGVLGDVEILTEAPKIECL